MSTIVLSVISNIMWIRLDKCVLCGHVLSHILGVY